MSRSFQSIILAAGKGTRMKSDRVKVLHEVAGRPIIGHVVQASLDAGAERVVLILGHQRAEVEAYLENEFPGKFVVALQEQQLGTGHAVYSAKEFLENGPECSVIVSGDVPNLDGATLSQFIAASEGSEFGVMTAILEDAAHYGRMLRGDDGVVSGIIEYKDATPEQRQIKEINAGFYVAKSAFLLKELETLCNSAATNAQGEFYLTDVVAKAAETSTICGWVLPNNAQMQGVNTRVDLAAAEKFAQHTINQKWMESGVTMLDPSTTYVEASVELAPDVLLHPNVQLRGRTSIASGTIVEVGCVINDCSIEPDAHIKANSYLQESTVGANSMIGPMAHLRPGTRVGARCKVGNFVEIKKSKLGDGAKASHLSYLGDATIGAGANIGAGTITCNYDGKNKHQTHIGEGVFIGSNSSLVAPIIIADGAYVGAGSTITKDIPEGSLGVARGRQQNIDGWARRRRNTQGS